LQLLFNDYSKIAIWLGTGSSSCSPSYSGSRDQEEGSSKPTQANSKTLSPIKNHHKKIAVRVAQAMSVCHKNK
jgi:hypothetical protein